MPDVSVIVTTTFRNKKKLVKLLTDVLASTDLENFELLLILDAVPDYSADEISKMSFKNSKLKICKVQESFGPFNALIQGALNSECIYISQQNDDDPYRMDRIPQQLGAQKIKNFNYSCCRVKKTTSLGFRLPNIFSDVSRYGYTTLSLLLGSYGSDASLIMDKTSFLNSNPSSYSNLEMADWAWGLNELNDMNTTFVHDIAYIYLQHPRQISRSNSFEKKKAFHRIFLHWSNRNKSEGLPILTESEAFAVSIGSLNYSDGIDIGAVENWFALFLERCYSQEHLSIRAKRSLKQHSLQKLMAIYMRGSYWDKLIKIIIKHPILFANFAGKSLLVYFSGTRR